MALSQVESDLFGSSIDSDWNNGWGDWSAMAWATGSYVETASVGTDPGMANTGNSLNNNQYAEVTIEAHLRGAGNQSNIGVLVRAPDSTSDESCYTAEVITDNSYGNNGHQIRVYDSAFSATGLTNEDTAVERSQGDTLRLEVEGNALRMYVNDTLVSSTTDSTISSNPHAGCTVYTEAAVSDARIDSFRCGNIVAAGGSIPAAYHHLRQMHA